MVAASAIDGAHVRASETHRHHTRCGSWLAPCTATDNYQFLLNWFASYPEYSQNDFYITGERYAVASLHFAPSTRC